LLLAGFISDSGAKSGLSKKRVEQVLLEDNVLNGMIKADISDRTYQNVENFNTLKGDELTFDNVSKCFNE